jgi:hypothetical protein
MNAAYFCVQSLLDSNTGARAGASGVSEITCCAENGNQQLDQDGIR